MILFEILIKKNNIFGQMKQVPQLASTIEIRVPVHMDIMYMCEFLFAANVWNSPNLPRTSKYKL